MLNEEEMTLLINTVTNTVNLGLAQSRAMMTLSSAIKQDGDLSENIRSAAGQAFGEVQVMLEALEKLNEISQELVEVFKRER